MAVLDIQKDRWKEEKKLKVERKSLILLQAYSDVLVVLAQLVRSCHHFSLSDPLLQIVHLAVQLEKTEPLVQFSSPLLRKVLQSCVQLIHL